jgi:acetyl esterase/lipase
VVVPKGRQKSEVDQAALLFPIRMTAFRRVQHRGKEVIVIARSCIVLVLLASMGTFVTARGQDGTLPERTTFTFPPQLEGFAKGLEEAGVHIVYGPNSIPAPEGISEAAKGVWANLPQLPLPADDPEKLAAMREMTFLAEDAEFERFESAYSLEDRAINGITTLWITPTNLMHDDKVMIFIHGGGWILNSRKTQLPLQTAVADSLGAKVVSIEYPLAPEHPYPAALNDVVAAYEGIISEYGADNAGLFGTSAGGGIMLATLLRLSDNGLPLPAASAALSPGADMTASGHMYRVVGLQDPILPPYGSYTAMRAYVGEADPKDPFVSPVFGDYSGVSPLFLLTGTSEIVASDAIRVAASARSQGVDVTLLVSDGMWHVPISNGSGVPELQMAYDEMVDFFRRHMGF